MLKRFGLVSLVLVVALTFAVGCSFDNKTEKDLVTYKVAKEKAEADLKACQAGQLKSESDLTACKVGKTETEKALADCKEALGKCLDKCQSVTKKVAKRKAATIVREMPVIVRVPVETPAPIIVRASQQPCPTCSKNAWDPTDPRQPKQGQVSRRIY